MEQLDDPRMNYNCILYYEVILKFVEACQLYWLSDDGVGDNDDDDYDTSPPPPQQQQQRALYTKTYMRFPPTPSMKHAKFFFIET